MFVLVFCWVLAYTFNLHTEFCCMPACLHRCLWGICLYAGWQYCLFRGVRELVRAFSYACADAGGGRLLTRWWWVFANMFRWKLCVDYLLVIEGVLLLLARVPT